MAILYVLGAVVLINCFYFYIYSNFSFKKSAADNVPSSVPVSVLVCAKNEEENLQKHLPLLLNQNYPHYEIILINDASTDNTLEVMEDFSTQDSRIKIVDVKSNEAFWGSKKYALTLGIKRARYHTLLFTDADCYPASENWIAQMAGGFSDQKEIVLGYGGYEKTPGFLNKLIRYETVMTATQYFSYAEIGLPYMGVGRNLGYTSKVYYGNNGFINHIKLASGDDDLFVNEAATRQNTALCMNPGGFTYSIPKKNWQEWIQQKKRHYTTAKFYKPLHRALLGISFLSNFMFWFMAVITLFSAYYKIGLIIIAIRFLLQYFIVGKAAHNLREKDLIYFLPFFELFLILLQLSIFIFNRKRNKTQWK